MKKLLIMISVVGLIATLAACGPKTCKECDDTEIYKDGLCRYHYDIKQLEDAAKDAHDQIIDWIEGNEEEE